ncbi:nucleoside monophosphate kinase [Puniceicoccus vermicola]|uniref:Adenylate kinase n=1 Tax=Puniceicoccus vermicola TaxID=388746 RepID=A0A7X1B460_9BACT|nr:nucleoside monophosphate kinase [Puniceicoccus vermicola]MBC2604183.1 nucleoside monophosphate kinase [Puniceicoccus vermicola]
MSPPNSSASPQVQDLEVKDPQIIFERVWSQLEDDIGQENLIFPKEIFWLNGSPGAGKGTNTGFIMETRDLTADPITVSQLLKSPEARKRMDAGLLVGDREVTELVLRRLLDPEYQHGAIVDGFPRTKVQVECVKQLYAKLDALHQMHFEGTKSSFPKCRFHIIVLFIDEGESVKRQLNRGRQAIVHNEKVRESGVGEVREVRKTDLNEDAARGRYRTFKEITYHALRELQEVFHYHYIDAQGSLKEVQDRIIEELHYQSSLELDEGTYRRVGSLPIASSMAIHARQELVDRLDSYEEGQNELFAKVVEDIEKYFLPIIKRHAISGMALINTENEMYRNDMAIAMLIDVFSERGFHAVVDIRKESVPVRFDLETGEVHLKEKRIYRVRVNFGGSDIRKGR